MAKGNDGNLLQHFIECEVSAVLADTSPHLHLICTHAMEPFGALTSAADDPWCAGLAAALAGSTGAARMAAAPPLLVALDRTRAARARYPNTAELIAALRGDDQLSGVLCEKDAIHASVLSNRWAPTAVRVLTGNWRTALERGHLAPPDGASRPWLLTLDPYTWLLDHEVNKAGLAANLCRADLELLRPLLGRYASGEAPGAAIVLAYKLDEAHASRFRGACLHLADRLGLERTLLGTPSGATTRHLAAVLSPTAGLAAGVAEAWADFSADMRVG